MPLQNVLEVSNTYLDIYKTLTSFLTVSPTFNQINANNLKKHQKASSNLRVRGSNRDHDSVSMEVMAAVIPASILHKLVCGSFGPKCTTHCDLLLQMKFGFWV